MRFFLDNCLSPAFADALHGLSERDGHEVTHLRRKFDAGAKDEMWLAALGVEGDWIVVSGDHRIVKKPHLRKVWLEAKLTTFFMVDSFQNLKFWLQIRHLVRWWPDIVEVAGRVAPGAGFTVPLRSSRMEQVRVPGEKA